MLRNREQRRYQNHVYDAPSYLHLVQLRTVPRLIHDRVFNWMQ